MQNQENKVRGPAIRLSTVATTTRQTPKTDFGTVMRDGLIKAGNVAVEGLQVAAPFVPGGAIVSAAIAGANIAGNVTGTTSSGIATGVAGMTAGNGPGTLGGAAGPTTFGGGSMALPGARPGGTTALNQPASNFSGGFGSGGQGAVSGASDTFNQMMSATKTMAEFQASFNLQYLQLQEKIQQDTRQFNLVSNIMKTKHDAAKNALNNVR